MNRLKKVAVVLSAGLFALSIAGCSSSSNSSSGSADASNTEKEAATVVEEEETSKSEYAITIDSAEVTTDYEDNPAVVITYTFTNNSEDTTSMAASVLPKVFQNGVECDTAFVSDIDSGGYTSDLRPGASTEVRLAYEITDSSEIEVEVKEIFSFDDVILAEKTFTLE